MTVFLILVLLVTQILFDLYARSAVTTAAFDGARVVVGSDAGATEIARADAERSARMILGGYGSGAAFQWHITSDQVGLTIRVRNRTILPPLLVGPLGLDQVDRTAVVRRERVR